VPVNYRHHECLTTFTAFLSLLKYVVKIFADVNQSFIVIFSSYISMLCAFLFLRYRYFVSVVLNM